MLIIVLNVMITLLMIVKGHVDRGIDGCLANGDYGHIPNSVDDHSDHGDIGLLMVLIITDNTCAVYGYIVNIDGNITNVDAGHIANIDGNITTVDAGHIANGDAGKNANGDVSYIANDDGHHNTVCANDFGVVINVE